MKINKANKHKGFTILEMLIVVAIIAVLVAIAIPVLNKTLEKARQATDVANARSIKAQLASLIMEGEIEFVSPESNSSDYSGVWVLVWRGDGYCPRNYNHIKNNIFFGANKGVRIKGKDVNHAWNANDDVLQSLLASCFKNGSMKSYSRDIKTGWDWYLVQYSYDFKNNKLICVVNSGKNDGNSQALGSGKADPGNIQKWIKE